MLRFPHLLALAALLGMAACAGDFLETSPDLARSSGEPSAIVMSASRYTLTSSGNMWSGEIGFTFTNLSDRPLSLLNCRGGYSMTLEKWEKGEWVPGWSPVQLQCLSPPIVIGAGDTRDDVLPVRAGRAGSNLYPQFLVPGIDGTYRLVIGAAFWDYDHDGPPWGETLSLDLRVSDPFEIRTR